jgi:hypothetical protein
MQDPRPTSYNTYVRPSPELVSFDKSLQFLKSARYKKEKEKEAEDTRRTFLAVFETSCDMSLLLFESRDLIISE